MPDPQEGSSSVASKTRTRVFTGICIGYALVILDANVLNVAAPLLREGLGASPQGLLWLIDSYTLVFAAFLLSAGSLGDRHGARRIFLLGLGIFTAASLGCSLCRDATHLTAARAVQGLGAALLAPTSITLIRALYPESGLRARALATWAAISGIAFALGPLCGGALVTQAGWQSIFLMNLPLGLGAMALVRRGETGAGRVDAERPDLLAQALAALALGSLTFGLIETADGRWVTVPVIGGLAVSVVSGALFVLHESRKPEARRFIPGETLRPGPLLSGLAAGAAFNFALYGLLFALTLNLQGPGGLSPVLTGAAFLPLTAVHALVAAFLTGRLTEAHGPRLPLVLGLSACALGSAICAVATFETGRELAWLLAGLGVFGIGSGLTTAPMTEWVLANLPGRSVGIGSGVLNAARQVGGLVGVALLGSLTIGEPAGVPLAIALALVAVATAAAAAACARTQTRHSASPATALAERRG